MSLVILQSYQAISENEGQRTQKRGHIRSPMANPRLFQQRRRHPSSLKAQEKIALWEGRFRRAKSPESRYGAMRQIQRWTLDHPLIQMWEERDPRFNDMTWHLPLEGR